jgi:hypothetical protein
MACALQIALIILGFIGKVKSAPHISTSAFIVDTVNL